MYFWAVATTSLWAVANATWGAYLAAAACTAGPWLTRALVLVTTWGRMMYATKMTIRMIQPHTASPVAVRAGLWDSTVSVKLAIHGV